ncbi:unnamed protein product [Phytomonas sp. Hart1]|nr:unnamed protein product [Phytomonas sp. Hart1]|eukprot:CCW67521.1 unnamed protein product [Phytomonas sp. isolate Hart1]
MSSTIQSSTSSTPIQKSDEEKVISDSVEMRGPAFIPACLHTPQEAHTCAESGSTISRIQIASKKARKSKIQLQEEESQRLIEVDALINAEIIFTSKATTCDSPEPLKYSNTFNCLNSSIEVHSEHSESDDDNYYVTYDYPKLTSAERLEILKERVSEKMSEIQAKSRIQHGVARRPAVLSRTRYGQLKAIPQNFNSNLPKKLLEGPLPSSITPCCKGGKYVQNTDVPRDGNDDEFNITDKELSIESGSQ